jgi:hypothetical protein
LTSADFEQEKLELEALLASGIFDRAPNMAHLLRYVCEKHFEGTGDQIKEYNIAVEALGRPPQFDQKRDSIVRVEAHRLRKRLKEYYETEGASHAVRIEIQPGQYAPRFRPHEPAGLEPAANSAIPSYSPLKAVLPPETMDRSRRTLFVSLGLVLAVLAVGAWLKRPVKATSELAPRVTRTATPVSEIAAERPEIRILAGHPGGSYTDRMGRIWQGDRYFDGGSIFDSANHPILGTRDPRIFQTRREGSFSYDIPLPPGVYELRLYFAETLYGESNAAGGGETSRLFNVYINDTEVLEQFDVIADAGANEADIRAFKNVSPAPDGRLHLKFESHTNSAFLDALEITPGTPDHIRPIRLVSRDHAYTDKDGILWEPDRYARGGQLVIRTEDIAGAADPELYHGERFGNIRYVVPVPPGKYGVTLHFSEVWFGPGKPAGGGAGSRLFDILCNGVALRRGFDIFKEARGSNNAIRLPIHGLSPDAQGKLVISLVPIHNYASVDAIEIVDESK